VNWIEPKVDAYAEAHTTPSGELFERLARPCRWRAKEFNDHARDDPRVECVLLTVRDGMLLVRKR
jgi:predicted O-methyltransferase YrrM